MSVRIANITRPTTMLPRTTNLPKASITWPASAVSKIKRVDETLRARRNKV